MVIPATYTYIHVARTLELVVRADAPGNPQDAVLHFWSASSVKSVFSSGKQTVSMQNALSTGTLVTVTIARLPAIKTPVVSTAVV